MRSYISLEMKLFYFISILTVSILSCLAELPNSGLRAVSGGASPDGRWIVCVLSSPAEEPTDQLPEAHRKSYLVDLDTMATVGFFPEISTLGGYHGRPESNVTAKWFPDSKIVSIGWRVGRLNLDFSLFEVSLTGKLETVTLPNPLEHQGSLFEHLDAHSNCGNYLESITPDGDLVVVYYGFWPKDDAFFKTAEGKIFDRNRIEVIFRQLEGGWTIKHIASPGTKDKSERRP